MAKEIIDAIKNAEIKGRNGLEEAKASADRQIKEARAKATADYDAAIAKANLYADTKRREAEEKSAEVISKAENEALGTKSAMKKAAESKNQEAVNEVLAMLLR